MATSTTQNTSPTPAMSVANSPSASCNLSTASCGVPPPGKLYLFTFLATLVLLGMVAGAVIARSVYLRRRQAELIASGLWVPPTQRTARGDVNVAQKPRVFDAYLGEAVSAGELSHWDSILPLSALYLSTPVSALPLRPEPQAQRNNGVSPTLTSTRTIAAALSSRRRRILRPPNADIPAAPAIEPEVMIPLSDISASKLRASVAYIIAMPVPNSLQDGGEKVVPFLEFGVAEIDVVRCPGNDAFLEDDGQGKIK